MKKLISQILLIIPAAFIFNGRDFFGAITSRSLGSEDYWGADVILNCNTFGFVVLRDASLQYMLYTMTFAIIYLFMFGHIMADDLTVSGIYVFIRENKRIGWFIKNAARMFIQSGAVLTVNMSVIYYFTYKMCGLEKIGEVRHLIMLTVFTAMYIWILLMITNFMSVLFGSTLGLTISAAIHYTFVIAARYTFEAAVIKNINPLLCIFNTAEHRQDAATTALVLAAFLAAICIGFCAYVKRTDISLTNKETMM